jgi:hypothetical protein
MFVITENIMKSPVFVKPALEIKLVHAEEAIRMELKFCLIDGGKL